MSEGIVIKYLPLSGAVICYNDSEPVTEEEMSDLDQLMLKMRKVFAISMGGIPEEKEK